MSAAQREKGKRGEREVAALIRDMLGYEVRRRVRQHDGDSDLVGVPGWSIEVKRRACGTRGEIFTWYRQALDQAKRTGEWPALFYRLNRGRWWVVWPLSVVLTDGAALWDREDLIAETTPEGWAAIANEYREGWKQGVG